MDDRSMRVLLANKFLYPKGGAERAVLDLGAGLQARGHEVFWFGMDHPENTVPAGATVVVRQRDYRADGLQRYTDAISMIYSLHAKRQFAAFLKRVRPDIIHVHNIYHQLTPSILDAARQAGTPVVMTLHDYKLVCPRYDMLRRGRVCDRCVEQGPTACLRYRCAGSWAASLLLTCESAVHRSRGSYDTVQRFLTPSRFLRQVLERGGWESHRLRHLPNFTPTFATSRDATQQPDAERYLFAGRLSPEKGIETLLAACRRVDRGTLVICGAGPLEQRVNAIAAQLPSGRVQFKGHLPPDELASEIQRASFMVVPSEWFENAPFAVLEAMAIGRAVLASRIGGLPELIANDVSGVLVPPGDIAAWTECLSTALANPQRMQEMGAHAQDAAQGEFGFQEHLDAVLGIYDEVLH